MPRLFTHLKTSYYKLLPYESSRQFARAMCLCVALWLGLAVFHSYVMTLDVLWPNSMRLFAGRGYDPVIASFPDTVCSAIVIAFFYALTGSFIPTLILTVIVYGSNALKAYLLSEHLVLLDLRLIYGLWIAVGFFWQAVGLSVGAVFGCFIYRYFRAHYLGIRMIFASIMIVVVALSFIHPDETLKFAEDNQIIRTQSDDQLYNLINNGPTLAVWVYELNRKRLKTALAEKSFDEFAYPVFDFRSVDANQITQKPNIYIVVLESFLHPAYFNHLKFNIPPISGAFERFDRENTSEMFYNVRATAAAEFELLCGLPNRPEYSSKIFMLMRAQNVSLPCLPRYLEGLGYATIATHPNTGIMYNRKNAYPMIGFTRSIFEDELDMQDRDGDWLTDESLLNQNLAHIKTLLKEGKPFLNHILTVGGHLPYLLDAKRPAMLKVEPNVESMAMSALQISYYTTRALSHYIDEINRMDKNAVIVLVGDHFGYGLMMEDELFTAENAAAHKLPQNPMRTRIYQTQQQTYALIIHKGKTLRVKNLLQSDIPNIIVNLMTNEKWCKNAGCLHDKEYMFINDEVVSRGNPKKRACDDVGSKPRMVCVEAEKSKEQQKETYDFMLKDLFR